DGLLARTRPRRRLPASRIVYAAAIASLVAVAVLLVRGSDLRRASPPAPPAPAEAVQIADWESPTSFLLDTPGAELLSAIPTLASSSAAENASSPEPTKGVAR